MIPEHLLRELIPRAAAWAQRQERLILNHSNSQPLNRLGIDIARRAGVTRPEAVRILPVPEILLPEEDDLRQAASEFGVITPATIGLTLGRGIFVRQEFLQDGKLIAHELKHVAQYEKYGSFVAFMQQYLAEVNQHAYLAAPMEREAVAFSEAEFPTAG